MRNHFCNADFIAVIADNGTAMDGHRSAHIAEKKRMSRIKEVNMKKRIPWYRWTWEDGYVSICKGFSPVEMKWEVIKHGKCINKEFYRWDDEM